MSKLSEPMFTHQQHFCKVRSNCEPDALTELKYQLANINCKCGTCTIRNRKKQHRITIKHSLSATHVQGDRFIQAAPKTAFNEPKTQSLQNSSAHLRKLLCINEYTSGTDIQTDETEDSLDVLIQTPPKTVSIDPNKRTLQITNLRTPLYTNAYTSGTHIEADQTNGIVDKIIQAGPKTVSIEPDTQTLQIALTHLETPVYINIYTLGTHMEADQTDCSVDRFMQAGRKTVSMETDTQTLQIALTHLRKPLCTNGYTSCTDVSTDETDCSVDIFTQAGSKNVTMETDTQTLQIAVTHVRTPLCTNRCTSGTDIPADQIECSVDRFVQASRNIASVDPKTSTLQSALTQLYKHDVLCPTCTIAFNFLRGALMKVYKDEESSTVREVSTCHKSTSNDVACVDRTTSMTSRFLFASPRLSCSDFTSKLSSGTSFDHRSSRVRFRDEVEQKQYRMRQLYNLNYLCVETFIDSIRPPL